MYNFLTTAPAGGMGGSLIMIVAMFAVMYFMLIRPENKRKKEAEEMRSVVSVKEDKFVIETGADQVRVELAKWALSSNETAAEAQKAQEAKAKEAKAKAKAKAKAEKANKEK